MTAAVHFIVMKIVTIRMLYPRARAGKLRPPPIVYSALLAPLLSWHAWRAQRKIRLLQPDATTSLARLPSVSIIVAARNEAENLRRLLPSLQGLDYPGALQIIVVDDNSADETAAVARQHGAALVQLQEPPPGWLGKTNACHQGAALATGKWLLFTDADTWHSPRGLRQVVAYALAHELDAVSLMLAQETESALVKLILTIAFAALLAAHGRPQALFHGQYILVRREVYGQSGGFAAVRGELMEDLALGHHLHRAGYRTSLCNGTIVGSVHIYPNLRKLGPGLTRIGSGSLKWTGSRGWLAMLFVTAIMSPLGLLIAWWRGRLSFLWLLASWMLVVFSLRPWTRRTPVQRVSWLAPFAALLIQMASSWGVLRQWAGRGVAWKGRRV